MSLCIILNHIKRFCLTHMSVQLLDFNRDPSVSVPHHLEGAAELHCLIQYVGDQRRVVSCSHAPFLDPEKEESYWGRPDQQASCAATSKREGGKEIARKRACGNCAGTCCQSQVSAVLLAAVQKRFCFIFGIVLEVLALVFPEQLCSVSIFWLLETLKLI